MEVFKAPEANTINWQHFSQHILSNIEEGIAALDADNHILFCNSSFLSVIDKTREEVYNKPLDTIFPDLAGENFDTIYKGNFKNIHDQYLDITITPLFDAQDKFNGSTLILKKAAVTPPESTSNYPFFKTILEAIPHLAWTSLPDGSVNYINQKWTEYTGMHAHNLLKWGWVPFFHPEDQERVKQQWKQAISTGKVYDNKFRFRRASDGAYRWILARALPIRNEAGEITLWVGTCTDIHDQKLAEEALENRIVERTNEISMANEELTSINEQLLYKIEEREKLEVTLKATNNFVDKVTSQVPCLIAAYNIYSGQYIYINKAIEPMFGYSQELIMEKGAAFMASLIHPDDLPGLMQKNNTAIEEANSKSASEPEMVVDFEYRIKHKNGEWRWLQTNGTVFDRTTDGKVAHVLNISIDITEKKEAEHKYTNSQHLLEQITTATPDLLYIFDIPTHKNIYANRQMQDLLGYSQEQLSQMGDRLLETIIYPEDFSKINQNMARLLELRDGEILESTFRIKDAVGEWRWLYSRKVIFKRDSTGNPLQLFGSSQDITEKKNAETKLWEKQYFIERMADTMPLVLYIYDIRQQKNVYANHELQTLLGYAPEEVQQMGNGFLSSVVHPEDFPLLLQVMQQLAVATDEDTIDVEYRIRHSNGEWHWFYDRATVFSRDKEGTVVEVLGTSQDITGRKKAEEKLQESQYLIQQIADATPDIIYVLDLAQNKVKYVNKGFTSHLGYTPEQIYTRNTSAIQDLIHPEDKEVYNAYLKNFFLVKDSEVHEFECRLKDISGNWHWLCSRDTVFKRNKHGVPYQIIGIAQDITDKKSAEAKITAQNEALEKSEALLREAQRIAHIGSFEWNILDNTLTWSEEHYRIFGMPAHTAAISYEQFEKYIHPDDLYLLTRALRYSLNTLQPLSTEYRIVLPDSTVKYIHAKGNVYVDDEGTQIRMLGTAHDITERKLAEEKIRESQHFIKQVADSTPDVLYVYDLIEKRSIYINREIYQKLGYSPEVFYAMGDKVIQTITHPEDLPKRLEHFNKAKQLADGEILELEYRVRTVSGQSLWIRTRDSVFKRTPEGAVCQIMGVSQDITERKLAEEKLIESQRFIQQIADATPDMIYVLDLIQQKNVYVNKEIFYTLGYGVEEIISQSAEEFKQLIHPEDQSKHTAHLEAFVMVKDNEIREVEYRLRDKQGNWHWLLIRNAVFKRTPEGIPYQIIGIVRDITTRKTIEEEIRAKNKIIEAILSKLPVIVTRVDKDGLIQEAIGSGLQRLGLHDNQLKGVNVFETYKDVATYIRQALQGEAVTFTGVPQWNGHKRYFLNNYFFDEEKQCAIGFSIDITEQKRAEEKLKESEAKLMQLNEELEGRVEVRTRELAVSEERFRLITRATNDAIWDWDLQTDLIWWNEGFKTMFGYKTEDIELGSESWYSRIHPEEVERVLGGIHKIRESGGEQWTDEYRFRKADGSYAFILDRGYILHNKQGKAIRMLGSMVDITYMKETQEALEQQAMELKQSNADLEQFAFISSHDLQEPLNTASSFAKLLSKKYKDKLDEDGQEFIDFIVNSTDRMKLLIRSLLDYSKINSAGKSFESTDMANVLAEVEQNLQSSIQETNANITIDTLPVLPANRQQMVQLFQHLLNNAIKFRSALPLHIHISAIEQEEHYLFSVSDTGIGMEMKYTRKIFQVFQRLHSRDEYEGAGIGLAACKRIVERHNGNIWVESQPGQGSTFFFTLKKN